MTSTEGREKPLLDLWLTRDRQNNVHLFFARESTSYDLATDHDASADLQEANSIRWHQLFYSFLLLLAAGIAEEIVM